MAMVTKTMAMPRPGTGAAIAHRAPPRGHHSTMLSLTRASGSSRDYAAWRRRDRTAGEADRHLL